MTTSMLTSTGPAPASLSKIRSETDQLLAQALILSDRPQALATLAESERPPPLPAVALR